MTFDSTLNRYLANLEFENTYFPPRPTFYGTLSAKGEFVAGGLQDNSNVYYITSKRSPWYPVDTSGDGGVVAVIDTGQVVSYVEPGGGGSAVLWRKLRTDFPLETTRSGQILPVKAGDSIVDANGLASPNIDAVISPNYQVSRLAGNERMWAVAGAYQTQNVYGLFVTDNGSDIHWEKVGTFQSDQPNDSVSAVSSLDGTTIMAGTSNDRLFQLKSSSTSVVQGQQLPLSLPANIPVGQINRIAILADDLSFATYNWGYGGLILRFDGTSWTPVEGINLPAGGYFALETDRIGKLFTATDSQVYVSYNNGKDLGKTWLNASSGLPKVPRIHFTSNHPLYDKYESATTNKPTIIAASLINFFIAYPATAPNRNPPPTEKIISSNAN
jgi:hypothetical protein